VSKYTSHMKELYALMKKKKLSTPEEIFEFCGNRKFEEVVETSVEAFAFTSKPLSKTAPSLFNFSASVTLSGGDYPCESLSCRMKKVTDLAKFSSVYADCTTIYNPFDFVYFFLNPHNGQEISPEKFRFETMNAFTLALGLRPLIERELIVFSRTLYLMCANCKKKRDKIRDSVEIELDNIAEKALFPLIKREAEIKYEEKSFHLTGTEPLIGEDLYFHYEKLPSFLIKNGKRMNSIDDIEYSNPLIQKIIGEAIGSLMFQKICTIENLTQTYLTTNTLEKILLEEMGKQAESRALKFFVKGLPVIQGMPYEDVIEIRDSYPDEFKSFQVRASELIGEAKKFETQIEFDMYVSSELEGELKNLKKIQEEGTKKLIRKGFVHGVFLGASITVSTITNYDVPYLLEIAQACYGCKNVLSDSKELEERVRKSPMYFYYKLSS